MRQAEIDMDASLAGERRAALMRAGLAVLGESSPRPGVTRLLVEGDGLPEACGAAVQRVHAVFRLGADGLSRLGEFRLPAAPPPRPAAPARPAVFRGPSARAFRSRGR